MTSQIKTIQDIPVAYVAKKGHPSAVAEKAFGDLEQKVPLRGNKFYGVFDRNENEYRACVALTEANQTAVQGFAQSIIHGGAYACTTLVGDYYNILRQIKPAFDALAAQYECDPARSNVEFYKRHTEVVVMLPVKQGI